MIRFPSKTNAFKTLRNLGVDIGTIIDVGVNTKTEELIEVFGDKHHILFEPVEEFHDRIRTNYANVSFDLIHAGVSNVDGKSFLHKCVQENGDIWHSQIIIDPDRKEVPHLDITRLDTFMANRRDAKPYLVKIDVDGFEREILEGCFGIWDDIDVVVVEATQASFLDRMNLVAQRGFVLFDISDIVYYYNVFHQADLIMVSPRVMELKTMQPWQSQPFDWGKSTHVAMYEPRQGS